MKKISAVLLSLLIPNARNKVRFERVKTPKIIDRKRHSIKTILCRLRSMICRQFSRSSNLTLFLAFGITCTHLQALYQGNPATPGLIDQGFFLPADNFVGVRAGYQHDQVFDRNLKMKGGVSGTIEEFSYLADQGVVTLNFMDRLEVYGSAGAANFSNTDQINLSGPLIGTIPVQLNYQTSNKLIWGTGIRVELFSWGATALGADAKYQYAHPEIRWNTSDGIPFPGSGKLRYNEWQVALGLSHHVDIFTPYIGVTYSKVLAKMHGLSTAWVGFQTLNGLVSSFKLRSKDHVGLTLGCDLSTGKIIDLGVEVRLISEQALTLKGDIKF